MWSSGGGPPLRHSCAGSGQGGRSRLAGVAACGRARAAPLRHSCAGSGQGGSVPPCGRGCMWSSGGGPPPSFLRRQWAGGVGPALRAWLHVVERGRPPSVIPAQAVGRGGRSRLAGVAACGRAGAAPLRHSCAGSGQGGSVPPCGRGCMWSSGGGPPPSFLRRQWAGGGGPDLRAWLHVVERGCPPLRHSCAGRNPCDLPTPLDASALSTFHRCIERARRAIKRRRTIEALATPSDRLDSCLRRNDGELRMTESCE